MTISMIDSFYTGSVECVLYVCMCVPVPLHMIVTMNPGLYVCFFSPTLIIC